MVYTYINMKKQEKLIYSPLFAGLQISDEERFRVWTEIKKVGGLTFDNITKTEDGWFIQCRQVEGIIAAGTNPNPSDAEIETEIRQAIISAFNVKVENTSIASPFVFQFETSNNNN